MTEDVPATAGARSAPDSGIDSCILPLQGHRVILDLDLARLYGVAPGALRQAVDRNSQRFPPDFLIRVTAHELRALRTRAPGLLGRGWGGLRSRPLAFTEEGVAMLSSVLRSPRAVRVNVEIMRAFVRQRRLLLEHAELARKVRDLESRYDGQFKVVFDALRGLTQTQAPPAGRIGFHADGQ